MFYNKRIANLEFEIDKLNFKLNNPPKYKIGDKPFKGHVCTSVEYIHDFGYKFFGNNYYDRTHDISYEFINIETGHKSISLHSRVGHR